MPTIFDLLDRLAFLRGAPSGVLALLAAFVAVAAWDMRPAIAALLIHYLLAGLLFVDILDPRLGFVYTLAGLFVAAILVVTARQVNWGRRPPELTEAEAERLGLPRERVVGRLRLTDRSLLRLILAAASLIVVWGLARLSQPILAVIPQESAYLEPAILGLIALGLVGLATSAEPLPAGIGLLLFLTGFALYDGFFDQSLAMTVALIIVQLTAALIIGYLAQARYLPADALD
jgi:hypothetical protein